MTSAPTAELLSVATSTVFATLPAKCFEKRFSKPAVANMLTLSLAAIAL